MPIPPFLRVALAIELLLASMECAVPALRAFLPLGHSVMAQTGIIICVCFVYHELRDSFREPRE
jgi:hypothetical protein